MEHPESLRKAPSPAERISERSKKNRKAIDQCLLIASNPEDSQVVGTNFSTSMRERGLFTTTQDWSGKNYPPLAPSLFNIEPEDTSALREVINGKNILLVGGGKSLKDLTLSKDFIPSALVNIDPYVSTEEGARPVQYYEFLPLDATDSNLPDKLAEKGHDSFDEIWSAFSIPQYCQKPEGVARFFRNVYEMLAPEGHFRMFPIIFYPEHSRMFPLLLAGLNRSLNELAKKPDIELSVLLNPEDTSLGTLEMHKLDPKKNPDLDKHKAVVQTF